MLKTGSPSPLRGEGNAVEAAVFLAGVIGRIRRIRRIGGMTSFLSRGDEGPTARDIVRSVNALPPHPWSLPPADVAGALGVRPGVGLSQPAAARRLDPVGPDRLRAARTASAWTIVLRQ